MNKIFKIINFVLSYLIIGIIFFYQAFISPILRSNCRYSPSCSNYAIESLKAHGVIKGLYFTLKRLLSCHPFGKFGYDPVKKVKNK
tara:strand:- start:88 stop:345 length:258 start_codon:yes stop_codon:yes gene_type:complete